MSPVRILIAKPGLDGHDRGAKIVARALRDAGYEVIYTGIRQTPEMIVATAIQENVRAIGLSILSGAHKTLLPEIVRLLKKNVGGKLAKKITVFAGGIIPTEDITYLKSKGITEVFRPGTTTQAILDFLKRKFG
ncbi:MAG: cobalamin B12-binding domain-containing protein [Elusimicrobia bacterium]|nr:cobalamin B12-binding domain-containing protein [Elusimicrobiota bacterium]